MFPNLLSLKTKNVLGIDVGHTTTKIVKLAPRNGGRIVEFCGLFPEPSTDPLFAAKLRDYLNKNSLTGLAAAACLDEAGTKIRKIELPRMPEADLRDAVRWKMRDVVEGAIDDYIVRHSLIAETDGAKKLTLVGYAVKNEAVQALIHVLRQSGVHPEYIEPMAVSFASCMESAEASGTSWTAGVDLGANKSIMVITEGGHFYFSRLLPGIKIVPDVPQEATFKQKLAAEIQNTLDTFAVTFHTEEMHKIYLAGGGADLAGLTEHLTTNLGIKTEVLDPFSGMEVAPAAKQMVSEKPFLFSQALALARMAN